MPAKKEISLLPDDQNSNLLSARIYHWAITVGRVVIVLTEFIVIVAFLSRFYLDRRNSDLSEIVRQQKAILSSTADFEKQYSNLQQRLSVIKKFYDSQPDYQPGISSLVESTPPDIVYDSLVISKKIDSTNIVADLDLVAYQESSIVDFITNLLLNPQFSSVTVNSIEKKPKDTKYTVSITLTFAPTTANATPRQ